MRLLLGMLTLIVPALAHAGEPSAQERTCLPVNVGLTIPLTLVQQIDMKGNAAMRTYYTRGARRIPPEQMREFGATCPAGELIVSGGHKLVAFQDDGIRSLLVAVSQNAVEPGRQRWKLNIFNRLKDNACGAVAPMAVIETFATCYVGKVN